jgi:hypothetical protein
VVATVVACNDVAPGVTDRAVEVMPPLAMVDPESVVVPATVRMLLPPVMITEVKMASPPLTGAERGTAGTFQVGISLLADAMTLFSPYLVYIGKAYGLPYLCQ